MSDEFKHLPVLRRVTRHPCRGARRGTVFFMHGFGLYAAKFEPLLDEITKRGYDVISHDALGHGDCKIRVDASSIEATVDATWEVYDAVAAEKPLLLGIGSFGGFMMRRLIERARGSDWVPPAIFYSVEYVNLPGWLLRGAQRPWILRLLDRVQASYDYRSLTRDARADEVYIDQDPRARVWFPAGVAFKLAFETNRFYDLPRSNDSAHAFIIGAEDTISYLAPLYRVGSRQHNHRLWEVPSGKLHLHRDAPDVQGHFYAALEEALEFVAQHSGLDIASAAEGVSKDVLGHATPCVPPTLAAERSRPGNDERPGIGVANS